MLKSFIFALLLEATSKKKENGRVWLLYNCYLAALKVTGPETIHIKKIILPYRACVFRSVGSNMKNLEIQMIKQKVNDEKVKEI